MALPAKPLATGSAVVNGTTVELRSLSRAEVKHLARLLDDNQDGEAYVIAAATGETMEEATKWLDSVGNDEAKALIDSIWQISGLASNGPKA